MEISLVIGEKMTHRQKSDGHMNCEVDGIINSIYCFFSDLCKPLVILSRTWTGLQTGSGNDHPAFLLPFHTRMEHIMMTPASRIQRNFRIRGPSAGSNAVRPTTMPDRGKTIPNMDEYFIFSNSISWKRRSDCPSHAG